MTNTVFSQEIDDLIEREGISRYSFQRFQDKQPPGFLTSEQISIFQALKEAYPKLHGIHYLMVIFAKKKLERCLDYAQKFVEVIETYDLLHLNARNIQRIIEMEMLLVLPNTYHTKQEHGILWVKGKNLQSHLFSERDLVQSIYFLLMLLMYQNDRNIQSGIVIICDLNEFGRKNLDFKLEKVIKQLFGYFPILFKRAWIINAPWYIQAVMKVFRPFMSQKIAERYCLSTLDSMREGFDHNKLPLEYQVSSNNESENIQNIEHPTNYSEYIVLKDNNDPSLSDISFISNPNISLLESNKTNIPKNTNKEDQYRNEMNRIVKYNIECLRHFFPSVDNSTITLKGENMEENHNGDVIDESMD